MVYVLCFMEDMIKIKEGPKKTEAVAIVRYSDTTNLRYEM